jgi:hypothetical protein
MKLYWVTTKVHHENLFIVASSNKEASKFHEENERYNIGDATAVEVVDIPADITIENRTHLSLRKVYAVYSNTYGAWDLN